MIMRFDVSLFSIPALMIALTGLVMGIVLIVGGTGAIARVDVRTDQHAWPAAHEHAAVARPVV